MLPRSGCTADRMSVARSMTWATRSSPWQMRTPSTAVEIEGKVLSLLDTGRPFSKGL